jgi:hypothetical protein
MPHQATSVVVAAFVAVGGLRLALNVDGSTEKGVRESGLTPPLLSRIWPWRSLRAKGPDQELRRRTRNLRFVGIVLVAGGLLFALVTLFG